MQGQLDAQDARFSVLDQLGQGGMGVVYRAFDRDLGRDVALKTSRRPDPGDLYRLKQEFRSRRELHHPNLVQLHDLVIDDRRCFFTMELLDARDLMGWIRDGHAEALPPTLELDPSALGTGEDSEPPPVLLDEAGEDRLRRGIIQLLQGLEALHAAGLVHRDVKPGNVLVNHGDERVVLVDFGLVMEASETESASTDSLEGAPVGSIPYMAPEQISGIDVTPAADLYAVGTMLYEALAGVRPYRGSALAILHQKATTNPIALFERAPGLPRDLCELADALLQREAERRPSAREALEALGVGLDRLSGSSELPTLSALLATDAIPQQRTFVGREAELEALGAAFRRSLAGSWTTVHVHGLSGIGKSTLVQRFRRTVGRPADAIVLSGRCHPQEDVPFKALDGVIDRLSHELQKMSVEERLRLAPRHGRSLLKVFPVLGRVRDLVDRRGPEVPPDPREQRRRAFEALRELLSRLADQRGLILWIDDLQWGDLDSASLLHDFARADDPPSLLLVLSYRREDLDSPIVKALREHIPELAIGSPGTVELPVEPLAPGEGQRLAATLLDPDESVYDLQLDAVVAESQGNPFLLCEMARFASHNASIRWRDEGVKLANVVGPRLEGLDVRARALLDVLAIAGRPLARSLALEAASLGPEDRPLASQLVQENLLRPVPAPDDVALAPYHDRIRETALAHLSDDRATELHRAIARVLEARQPDELEALATHWAGAGEPEAGGAYALAAAQRAESTLAFDRASQLYADALELLVDLPERAIWEERRAGALVNAGRGVEAASAFLAAAVALEARRPDDPHVLHLRASCAEFLIKGAQTQRATVRVRDVLGRLGVDLPDSPARTLLSTLWLRLRLLLRGLRFTVQPADAVAPARLARLDALWRMSASLAMLNHGLSDLLGVRHLLWALDTGEPFRLAHALAKEASFESILRGRWFRRRSRLLMERAAALWADSPDPYDKATLSLSRGIVAYFDGRLADVDRLCTDASAVLSGECQGAHWELTVAASFQLNALALRGELPRLGALLDRTIREADEAGDCFAADNVRMSEPAIAWLAQDRPAEVLRQVALASERLESAGQAWPEAAFRTQHYHRVVSLVLVALYEGRAQEAVAVLDEAWPALGRAGFLRLRFIGIQLRQLRARALLRVGEPAGVAEVAREAKRIARSGLPCAKPWAELLRASLAAGRGADPRPGLRRAVGGFDTAGMLLYREAARWRLGERNAAEAWMRKRGVVHPERIVELLAPGVGGTWSSS